MQSNSIELLKKDYDELITFFKENRQLSFEISINDNYRKNLLLSAASFFEAEIVKIILEYAHVRTKYDEKLISFIDSKALTRQYHTLFDWEAKNCNRFFQWFGENTKTYARNRLQENNFEESEKNFLKIGRNRNILVHKNFAEAIINDTFEDIYKQYQSACIFVELIKEILYSNIKI